MRRILIIRFSSIGDIVLTSPVIRCLKNQLPAAEIHFLTKKQYFPVLQGNPFLRKVWLYDNNFRDLIPQLKSQDFDFIVDLHKNWRSGFVKSRLHVANSTFPKLNIKKWMIVNLRINLLPAIHIVERYFRAVEKLGVQNDGEGLDYFIPPEDEFDIKTLPEFFAGGFVAIVTGGKHNTKKFPAIKIIEVCNRIRKPVILLGGKEDREGGEQITGVLGEKVYNACGILSLNQSASIVRQADSVLTSDTGLMHIAAAFNKPMVSVWGNTIPEFGMFPYFRPEYQKNSFIAEVKELSCRPCSKLGYSECPKGHFKCMNLIDTEEIANHL